MIQTDGELLLATILDPKTDSDGARLAYSDWLEEQGDTHRAEFIRVQCELADIEAIEHDCGKRGEWETTCPACGAYGHCEELRQREQELIRSFAWRWLRDGLPSAIHAEYDRWCDDGGTIYSKRQDDWSLTFRRGFVAEVAIYVADWIENADAILKLQPVREVSFPAWPGLNSLVRTPDALRIRAAVIERESEFVRRQLTVSQMVAETFGAEWPGVTFTMPGEQP